MRTAITEHGAMAGAESLCTGALQSAIDAVFRAGGGTVIVPSGLFVTGTIELKRGVLLHLDHGAVLRASGRLDDIPPNRFRHNEWGDTRSLLFAIDADGTGIVGSGTIDLNDEPYIDWNKTKIGDCYEPEVMAQATPEQLAESSVEPKPRPTQPIFFHGCRGLRIEDVTIRRSPCWTLSLSTCDDVRVRGISILNDLCVPNSDGVHLSACRDVIVSDCVLSCGDDCVAITGITNWDRFCERIIVHDCVMVSRSAGVRIGHLASKVRQVLLSNLVITDSQRGIGVFAGKGGIVENVQATNLTIDTRIVAGHWWGKGEPMVVSAHDGGKIRNVRFSGVRARSENGIVVCGGNGEASRIELDDIRLDLAYGRNRPLLGKWIDLQPAPLRPAPDAERHIPWIWADNVRDLTLHRIRYGRARSESQGFGVDGVLNDIRELSMADVAEG